MLSSSELSAVDVQDPVLDETEAASDGCRAWSCTWGSMADECSWDVKLKHKSDTLFKLHLLSALASSMILRTSPLSLSFRGDWLCLSHGPRYPLSVRFSVQVVSIIGFHNAQTL